ncbi:hypothetical protein HOG21_03415 [bacterium]|jgi:hypothetical protein|nr:hypothetical protein [bacterium]
MNTTIAVIIAKIINIISDVIVINIIENIGKEKIKEYINLFNSFLLFSIFISAQFSSFILKPFDSVSFFISSKLISLSSKFTTASFVAKFIHILSTQDRSFNDFSISTTQLAQVIHSIINLFCIFFYLFNYYYSLFHSHC